MLLPLSDVPRWYAQRKPEGTIAVQHGQDRLTWDQLERGANRRARAFAAKGVKPGDFVAIGLPNSNAFFEWMKEGAPSASCPRKRGSRPSKTSQKD